MVLFNSGIVDLYVLCLISNITFISLCNRKRMWSTLLRKISTIRYWVWPWLATFALREDSTHLVRHWAELTPTTSHDLTDATTHCSHTHSVTVTHGCVFLTDELIATIHSDIEEAKIKLDLPEHLKLKEHNFFKTSVSTTANQILNGHRL